MLHCPYRFVRERVRDQPSETLVRPDAQPYVPRDTPEGANEDDPSTRCHRRHRCWLPRDCGANSLSKRPQHHRHAVDWPGQRQKLSMLVMEIARSLALQSPVPARRRSQHSSRKRMVGVPTVKPVPETVTVWLGSRSSSGCELSTKSGSDELEHQPIERRRSHRSPRDVSWRDPPGGTGVRLHASRARCRTARHCGL